MKDTKGVRQVLEILVPRVGEIDGMTEELRGQAIDTATQQLQEIMLGMLPEKQYTTVGLVVDPHDLSKGQEGKVPIQNEFNRAIKLMEQNIRGGFNNG